MIISGYAGVGKSYLAHNFANVIDLESTPFEKDWERYAKCAIHYHNQGYLVLTSCHKDIRKLIIEQVPTEQRITIVPNINDKEFYRTRYAERGNTEQFIQTQMDNWEKWLGEAENKLESENWQTLNKGENLFNCIIRLSKESPLPNPLRVYTKQWIGI